MDEHLDELARLVDTAGAEVVGRITQQIQSPTPGFLIGEGKVEEVRLACAEKNATLVIFDEELTPTQGANLERELKVRVMDRAEVILDIFSTRARSHEAKLQVELAQLEYMLPRLTRMWTHLSRIRGGIGLRGPGETQLETDRRMIRKKIQLLREKLRGVGRHRATVREGRESMLDVALVGYTNAGQVEPAARAERRARHRGGGPPLRHARHAHARRGHRRGVPRARHRHRRVHPQAAAPAGGELPRHARGGPRRPTSCSTWSMRATPSGKTRCGWWRKCSRNSTCRRSR